MQNFTVSIPIHRHEYMNRDTTTIFRIQYNSGYHNTFSPIIWIWRILIKDDGSGFYQTNLNPHSTQCMQCRETKLTNSYEFGFKIHWIYSERAHFSLSLCLTHILILTLIPVRKWICNLNNSMRFAFFAKHPIWHSIFQWMWSVM